MKSAIILAGGMGTRLKSVISDVPKPMAPVQGRPFLEILMTYWRKQGIEHFILSVGHLAHIIQDHFGDRWQDCQISYSVETEPLGTGGGILQACSLLSSDEPTIALNGDTFFAVNLDRLFEFHLQNKADITLSVFSSVDTERYMGLITDQFHKITALNINTQTQTCLVNGGVYALNPAFMKTIAKKANTAQSWENECLPQFLATNKRLFTQTYSANFIDIGVPADYAKVQEFNFSNMV